MPTRAHVVIYAKDAAADGAFFRDILGFRSVDAGHGWLIFWRPAAEVAFHPHDQKIDDVPVEGFERGNRVGSR